MRLFPIRLLRRSPANADRFSLVLLATVGLMFVGWAGSMVYLAVASVAGWPAGPAVGVPPLAFKVGFGAIGLWVVSSAVRSAVTSLVTRRAAIVLSDALGMMELPTDHCPKQLIAHRGAEVRVSAGFVAFSATHKLDDSCEFATGDGRYDALRIGVVGFDDAQHVAWSCPEVRRAVHTLVALHDAQVGDFADDDLFNGTPWTTDGVATDRNPELVSTLGVVPSTLLSAAELVEIMRALFVLAESLEAPPDVLRELIARVRTDPSMNVRKRALALLETNYPAVPETKEARDYLSNLEGSEGGVAIAAAGGSLAEPEGK